MKKIILCILGVILIAALTGCGNKTEDPGNTTEITKAPGELNIIDKEPDENKTTAAPVTSTPATAAPTAEPTSVPDDNNGNEDLSSPTIDDIVGQWIEDTADKSSARRFIVNWDETFNYTDPNGLEKFGSIEIVEHYDWNTYISTYSFIMHSADNYADYFGFTWDPSWRTSQARTYIDEFGAYFVKDPTYDPGTKVVYNEPFTLDPFSKFFNIDTTLFGLSFSEFKQRLYLDDSVKLEDWPWWGHDLQVVYIVEGVETFACFFQKDRLVIVYRDSERGDKDEMYDDAVEYYGEPTEVSTYWNGLPAYEWKMKACRYQQHVETYDDADHYRQQYISWDYEE